MARRTNPAVVATLAAIGKHRFRKTSNRQILQQRGIAKQIGNRPGHYTGKGKKKQDGYSKQKPEQPIHFSIQRPKNRENSRRPIPGHFTLLQTHKMKPGQIIPRIRSEKGGNIHHRIPVHRAVRRDADIRTELGIEHTLVHRRLLFARGRGEDLLKRMAALMANRLSIAIDGAAVAADNRSVSLLIRLRLPLPGAAVIRRIGALPILQEAPAMMRRAALRAHGNILIGV